VYYVQATPLYLSEMAPFKLRGALNIMFQVRTRVDWQLLYAYVSADMHSEHG